MGLQLNPDIADDLQIHKLQGTQCLSLSYKGLSDKACSAPMMCDVHHAEVRFLCVIDRKALT